jgi:hypothetical protein
MSKSAIRPPNDGPNGDQADADAGEIHGAAQGVFDVFLMRSDGRGDRESATHEALEKIGQIAADDIAFAHAQSVMSKATLGASAA